MESLQQNILSSESIEEALTRDPQLLEVYVYEKSANRQTNTHSAYMGKMEYKN